MHKNISFMHIILAIIVMAFWGFNYTAAKIAMVDLQPFTMLTIRFIVVALILLPFYRKPPAPIKDIAIISFLFAVMHLGCMFWSLHLGLNSSIGGVTAQLGTPFVLILGVIFLKEKINLQSIVGIILAIVGTFFLMATPHSLDNIPAFLLMVGSAFFWAIYSIKIKQVKEAPALALICWISILAVPMMAIFSLWLERGSYTSVGDAHIKAWTALLYTTVAASIGGHGLWYYLLARNSLHVLAPLTLLVPLFGIVGGVVMLDEAFTSMMFFGTLLMLAGVGVVVIRKPRIARMIKE